MAGLLVLSLNTKERSFAVVAEVEAQKTAISYNKPVRVKKLHVKPGQHVALGDLLIEVERPDLDFDIEKIKNKQSQIVTLFEKLHLDHGSGQQLANLKYRLEISRIDGQIAEIESKIAADSIFYSDMSVLVEVDSASNVETLNTIKISNLENEKDLVTRRFVSERQLKNSIFEKEIYSLNLQKDILEKEMMSLSDEKKSLIQYATFNGTIGSVSVQLMELIPPYQTIISVYDENPNIIKAYMNEQAEVQLSVGDVVQVESINRMYKIEGIVIEIGSRIVSFPKQMISPQLTTGAQIDMWGKEVFVQIPDENDFLNGEKVFVIINQ